MWWGFELEFKSSLRAKKLWVILGIMILFYIPGFYLAKSQGISVEDLGGALGILMDNINSSAGFFIAILALLIGATAINSEIEKGTLRIAMSKPVRRISYIGGKFMAHVTILLIALLFSTVIGIIGLLLLGTPFSWRLLTESLILNLLLLLAMVQLVALGYILSTYIKSSTTALGVALAVFFVLFLILPSIVQFIAISDYIGNPDQPINWEEVQGRIKEYTTRYLFYVPTQQVKLIVGDAFRISGGIMNPEREYIGLSHAIGKNVLNLGILVGLTGVYLAVAFYRFLRMDLR